MCDSAYSDLYDYCFLLNLTAELFFISPLNLTS